MSTTVPLLRPKRAKDDATKLRDVRVYGGDLGALCAAYPLLDVDDLSSDGDSTIHREGDQSYVINVPRMQSAQEELEEQYLEQGKEIAGSAGS